MQIETTIVIHAPPELVWDITLDFKNWPRWAPHFISLKREDTGPFGVGSSALILQKGLPETRWVVVDFRAGERFSWEARVRGIRMIGTHEIRPHADGAACTLRVACTGFWATILSPIIRPAMRSAIERENLGLKAAAESRAARN